jgi:hypothetical protein
MSRLLFAIAATLGIVCVTGGASAATNSVIHYDRSILKEPKYQSTPKYSLITMGDASEVRIWMVEDGKRLFIDKNANGDLTDDGPPIEPNGVRDIGGNRWDFEYVLDAITPANGPPSTNFVLRRWNYNDPEDQYGLSLTANSRMPMYAGWFGTFWSTNRETAPVIHFGGPFKPILMRRENFPIGEKGQRLSLGFFHRGSDPGAESRLSIDALPQFVVPQLRIDWPTAPGSVPLRTTHSLTNRCCYWEFYTTDFEVPKGAVPGVAKISVGLVTGTMPIELTTTKIEAPVVTETPGLLR